MKATRCRTSNPCSLDEIRDPELLELIRRGEALGVPDALFSRILARAPDYAKAVLRALLHSHAEGNVDHRLKEIIRVQLARTAGDPVFRRPALGAGAAGRARRGAGSRRARASSRTTRASPRRRNGRCATRARCISIPRRIDAAFYAEGKNHYTEAQIMELGAFIAFHYGMQAFARTLGRRRRGLTTPSFTMRSSPTPSTN